MGEILLHSEVLNMGGDALIVFHCNFYQINNF
jgi:hypothetical protein